MKIKELQTAIKRFKMWRQYNWRNQWRLLTKSSVLLNRKNDCGPARERLSQSVRKYLKILVAFQRTRRSAGVIFAHLSRAATPAHETCGRTRSGLLSQVDGRDLLKTNGQSRIRMCQQAARDPQNISVTPHAAFPYWCFGEQMCD